jgi:hypothetical protein
MAKKKIRPAGDITLELEILLEELSFDHDLQHGEVLALVYCWLMIHAPDQREKYLDGKNPIFYYGPDRKNDITE